jgi:hypothetical protein
MAKCMGLIVQRTHVSDCSTGKKSSLIQEMSFCLVWGIRSMRPVHFALIMAPRSSKASSQLMAGSCGEISENIIMCQCQRSDFLCAVRGMEVYSHCKSPAHTLYSRYRRSLLQCMHRRYRSVLSCALDHILLLIYYVEDAPAPSSIHSFQTHITDGKIYVTADPANTTKEKKSRPPKLLTSGSEVGGAGVVIVGGGSGAFHATESLRGVSLAHWHPLAGPNETLTCTSMDSRRQSQFSPRKRMRP